MRIKILSFGFMLLLPIAVMAQSTQDPLDIGRQDSLILRVSTAPDESMAVPSAVLDLQYQNDQNLIRAIAVGFKWDNKDVTLDSARPSDLAKSAFNYYIALYRSQSIDSSNKYGNFEFFAASMADAGLKSSNEPQLLARFYFSTKVWSKYDQLVVDTVKFSPGTTFTFVTENSKKYRPAFSGRLTIYDANRPCCLSYRGNIDGDPSGVVDISDFTYLLQHLYSPTVQSYPCPEAANVDGSLDGKVDLNDLATLMDFLYGSMTPPSPCPK